MTREIIAPPPGLSDSPPTTRKTEGPYWWGKAYATYLACVLLDEAPRMYRRSDGWRVEYDFKG